MNEVIGDVIPLAVGVAISPVPIIATIVMLLSPRAKGTSVAFLIGWVLGVVLALLVFTLLGSLLSSTASDGPAPIIGIVKIVLGALLLLLALGQWRKRPEPGTEPSLPKWMSAIDTLRPGTCLGLGFALAALNPKNLMMAAAAGISIGAHGLTASEQLIPGSIFVVIAVSTVAVPVIAYLVASARMKAPLDRLRAWLVAHNAAVMTVLLLVIGVVTISKGIGSL